MSQLALPLDAGPVTSRCGFPAWAGETYSTWCRAHQAHHLATHPNLDARSVQSLDDIAAMAERYEATS